MLMMIRMLTLLTLLNRRGPSDIGALTWRTRGVRARWTDDVSSEEQDCGDDHWQTLLMPSDRLFASIALAGKPDPSPSYPATWSWTRNSSETRIK
jgi:hypothetical protein